MRPTKKSHITVKRGSVQAKIYLTPTGKDYDSFTLVYWLDQTRKREVFGDLTEAKARAKQVVAAVAKGQLGAIQLTAQECTAFQQATALLRPTQIGLVAACREYTEAFKLLKGVPILQAVRDYCVRHAGEITSKSVQEVVDEFLKAKREGRSTRIRGKGRKVSLRYLSDLEQKLKAFKNAFQCQLGAVKAEQINAFLGSLGGEGRTRNNYRQVISVLFEFARKQKYVPRDHAAMDEVEMVAEQDFEIEIFTPEELVKLLNHADELLRPVLVIGAFSGLRTSEIERLDWDDVKFDTSSIVVKKGKVHTRRGRARRVVPMLPNLAAWLKPVAQKTGRVWPHSAPYLFELQAEAATGAKVAWKHNALRHSFISYRIAGTNNVNEAALEAGNSPEMIFEHYRELVSPSDAAKWFSIIPGGDGKVATPEAPGSQKKEIPGGHSPDDWNSRAIEKS